MGELAKIETFRRQLAITETFEEIKLIGDASEAYQQLMKKQGISVAAQNEIGEFINEVEEKKGEYLEDKYPGNEGRMGNKREPIKMPASKRESIRARTIYKADKGKKQEIKDKIKKEGGVITPNKLFNELKKEEHKKDIEKQKEVISNTEFRINGLYDIIAIDPPWNYGRNYDPDGSRVANPYPEMTFEELSNIQIPAEENCVLWLWTTHAFIWDAKKLLEIWGFDYKAILIWNKEKMGMGSWLRMQCEFCLLGIKGKPIWDIHDVRDIINEPRREHSRKPEVFYEMINKNFVGKKIEIFSRTEREGWTVEGNDIKKFNYQLAG